MDYETFFPRGIAFGKSFCNRKAERSRLAKNIKTGQHTLLISPRRYGKTSLVKYAAEEMKVLYGEADLFVAIDAERIQQRLIAGIKTILEKINSPIEQVLGIIRDHFKKHHSQWTVGTQGVQLSLLPGKDYDPATAILEALTALEAVLTKKKQRAVLFIDEVQEVGQVAAGKGIEGAIRHVAQETKYLSLVFSGSQRHLLTSMFF